MFDKEKLHARLQHSLEYPVTFVKWLFCAVLTGHSLRRHRHGVPLCRRRRHLSCGMERPWLLYLLPVAGVAIVFSYRMAGCRT